MKHIPTLVSVLVIVWAVGAAMRVPSLEISWTVPSYLAAQCFFGLIGWWGLQREAVSSKTYLIFFTVGFAAVLIMAVICTWRFLAALPWQLATYVLIGVMFSASATAAVAYWRLLHIYPEKVPEQLVAGLAQATLLTICGSATLLTLFAEAKPAMLASALALGGFWALLGSFLFAYCVGIVRAHTVWERLNHYVPMMLTIAAFAWLAVNLSGIQRETAQQAVPAMEVAR